MIVDPNDFQVRFANSSDLNKIQYIELESDKLFDDTRYKDLQGIYLTSEVLSRLQRENLLWVICNSYDEPVGFAAVIFINQSPHLEQISVLPEYGNHGLGTKLINEICKWAKEKEYTSLTLSTFKDIKWNAPFYSKLGFKIVENSGADDEFNFIRDKEIESGLPIEDRVIMKKLL